MNIEFNYTAKKLGTAKSVDCPVFGDLEKDIIYTFSGKSSLALLLRYYRHTNRLRNRSDQVLVPQWLGDPVYMVMHEYCFPTTFLNEKVKGIMVYHQWGFPQDMDYIKDFCEDKKLFCIEDCAHSLESYYKGQRVGTFSETSFFSLAKFFPSVVGGAIYAKNKAVKSFVENKFAEDETELAKEVFLRHFQYDNSQTSKNTIELRRDYAIYGKLIRCPDYSLKISRREVAKGAIEKRKANYGLYKMAFSNQKYLSRLMEEDVAPWAVPLFFNQRINKKVVSLLRQNGVKSDVYHFDLNRNMLKPDFKECVPLPCHQGMTEDDIYRIIDIVTGAAK